MMQTGDQASRETDARERFHDRVISLLLAAIWIVTAWFVWQSDTAIPESMLILATLFFLMLVPAMKELVKILDKRLRAELGISEPQDDQQPGGDRG